MIGVVFLFIHFSAIEIKVSIKKFFVSRWRFRLLENKCKKIIYLRSFFVKLWEFENCQFGHALDKFMCGSNNLCVANYPAH